MAEVEYERDGHVARVTLNRPASLNALTPEMDTALEIAWRDIDADPDVWVAILRARGPRAFCAGADIAGDVDEPRAIALGGGLTGAGAPASFLRKPLVAAVHGYVLGAGFEFALCADIIVAATDVQFGLPEATIGMIGGSGVMHRAMRQLPHRVALGVILAGVRIGADDALRFGLVNEVVAPEDLHDAADRWADRLLAGSPLAVQAAKAAALGGADLTLDEALTARFDAIDAYADTADAREARIAFAERRPPVWRGR